MRDCHFLEKEFCCRATSEYSPLCRATSEIWVLRIRQVKAGDAGDYECQLSGDPPTTQTVTLVVHAKGVEGAGDEAVVQEVMVREEEVVAKVAKVVQRKGSGDTEGSDHEESLGGSSVVLAGGCLVVVLVCLLSLGVVRTCLGAEARAGERPMPCTKSTQIRRQRSTSRRRRATTSKEGEVVVGNDKNGLTGSQMEEESEFQEIPEWQTSDVEASGPRSVAKGGIQNVWDR